MTPAPRITRPMANRDHGASRGSALMTLLPPREHGIDERPQDHPCSEHDEKQRPRRAIGQPEQSQMSDLKPAADCDQPQTSPNRLPREELRRPDDDDDHRPVPPNHIVEIGDLELRKKKEDAKRDHDDSARERTHVDLFLHDLVHDRLPGALLTSTPPMTAAPRTISCLPVEAEGRTFTSKPPITGTTSPTISHS